MHGAEEVDDLDEVLNESIMDSIVGKRKAAEARTKKKRKRKDDDDDDDDENGYSILPFLQLMCGLPGYRRCYSVVHSAEYSIVYSEQCTVCSELASDQPKV